MHLGRVIGTVVATEKTPDLEGIRFLIVQPLDRDLKNRGRAVVDADGLAMAGPEELVYFVGSREAAQAMPETFVPVDHAIVGIVDHLAIEPLPKKKRAGSKSAGAKRVGK